MADLSTPATAAPLTGLRRAVSVPTVRPRRLRRSGPIRDLVAETLLLPQHLIYPLFVADHLVEARPVPSMPGVQQLPVWMLEEVVTEVVTLGVRSFLLFGVLGDDTPKDPHGHRAADGEGPVANALRLLRARFGAEVVLIADTCLCGYTDHGHCGPVAEGTGEILNDDALAHLAAAAVAQAQAGADFVAPSDMMDGRTRALREALDDANLSHVGVIPYSVKYASSFYGPFRDAAHSAPQFGDRRTYQMDVRNTREAVRELRLDIEEGADALIIKPGLPCLDIIARARQSTDLPVIAYSVSGEYSMVEAAAANGWLDAPAVHREMALSLRRAGADALITYAAPLLARQSRALLGLG